MAMQSGIPPGLATSILLVSGIVLTFISSFQQNTIGLGGGLGLVAAGGYNGVTSAYKSMSGSKDEGSNDD